ncbi:hypothetical protein E4U19_002163 [Claviceps sp. Clav32 group G5]|nr:hypothetical protein E4U19_002163 [Claviceps sp. Clav32 group G5]
MWKPSPTLKTGRPFKINMHNQVALRKQQSYIPGILSNFIRMASNAVVALQIRPVSLYSYVLGTEKTDNKDDPHHFTMVPSRYDGNITALQILKANFNNYELQHTNSGSPCFQVNEKAKKKKTCGKF